VFVSRQGGDEFVLVAASHSRAAALALAEQVLARLGQPYSVRGVPIRLSVSIGVAVDEGRATTAEALIQEADRAMYQAKSAGRAQVCLYDEAMQASAARREQLMAAVEEAVESHQLEVHYQPILDLTTMCTVGYEALLRWDHPLLGSVPPDTFIPLAETTGAVVALGGWVISQACAHVAELRLSTGDDLFVAINVSPRQLADPLFASAIQRELGRHDIPASAVVVEITETAAMTDLGAASAAVGRLRQLGLRVDLDDFGTGYSSLAYLRHLPVSGLKVDRSFVSALVESSGGDDRGAVTVADPIVPAIIQMAHALGIEVTAEGIETAEQLALLQGLGCDRGQGYLLGRPSPPPGAERPSTG
jgi:EAL domain-containing protein (putative c-di-GMP-specific phosphodiesterase class I)